jgi:hypothetical protein
MISHATMRHKRLNKIKIELGSDNENILAQKCVQFTSLADLSAAHSTEDITSLAAR